jgi:hypothetical protein
MIHVFPKYALDRVQVFAEAQAAAGADPEKVSPFSAKLNAATK